MKNLTTTIIIAFFSLQLKAQYILVELNPTNIELIKTVDFVSKEISKDSIQNITLFEKNGENSFIGTLEKLILANRLSIYSHQFSNQRESTSLAELLNNLGLRISTENEIIKPELISKYILIEQIAYDKNNSIIYRKPYAIAPVYEYTQKKNGNDTKISQDLFWISFEYLSYIMNNPKHEYREKLEKYFNFIVNNSCVSKDLKSEKFLSKNMDLVPLTQKPLPRRNIKDVKYVYLKIANTDSVNSPLFKKNSDKNSPSLMDLSYSAAMIKYVTLFTSNEYISQLTFGEFLKKLDIDNVTNDTDKIEVRKEIAVSNLQRVNSFIVKECWIYNNNDSIIRKFITALAPVVSYKKKGEDKFSEKILAWIYYPEFSNTTKSYTLPGTTYKSEIRTYDDFLSKRQYSAVVSSFESIHDEYPRYGVFAEFSAMDSIDNQFLEAVGTDNIVLVKKLIEEGADVNIKDNDGESPLHLAKSLEITNLLIEKGAKIDVIDNSGTTPLQLFCYCGKDCFDIQKLLIEKGANINAKVSVKNEIFPGCNVLHFACMKKNNIELIKLLIEKGADINAIISENDDKYAGYTALHFACRYGDHDLIKYLIEKGANVNQKTSENSGYYHNCLPLDILVKNETENICELLPLFFDKVENEITKQILMKGANDYITICKTPNKNQSFLEFICAKGNIEFSKVFFTNYKNAINFTDKRNNTPLYISLSHENYNLAEFLIQNGADVNHKNENKYDRFTTTLEYASYFGNYEMVKLLIDSGASVEKGKEKILNRFDNVTPIHHAAGEYFNVKILKLLIENGANVNIKMVVNPNDTIGESPLHRACSKANNLEIAKLLVESGANVNAKYFSIEPNDSYQFYWNGNTPLHFACCRYGNAEIAKFLIEKGADINAINSLGNTPLLSFLKENEQSKNEKNELAKFLIENGADVNIKNSEGYTALHLAVRNESFELTQLLLDKGALVEAVIPHENGYYGGYTPLLFAVEKNFTRIASLLINRGADISIKGAVSGYSALHFAAKNNNFILAFLLLEKGADINGVETNNYNAQTIAENFSAINTYNYLKEPEKYKIFSLYYLDRNKELFEYLDKNQNLIGLKNAEGNTLLHISVLENNTTVFKKLATYQNSINIQNTKGETALLVAVKDNKLDFVKKLIKNKADVNIIDKEGNSPLYIAKLNNNKSIEELLIKNGAKITIPLPKLVLPSKFDASVIAFSSDSKCFVSIDNADKSKIILYETETGREIKTFGRKDNNKSQIETIIFSPDSKFCLSVSGKNIDLWNLETACLVKTFNSNRRKFDTFKICITKTIDYSPDGKRFIVLSDKNAIESWDIETGKLQNKFICDTLVNSYSCFNNISYSPDGKYCISGLQDSTILWNIETGKVVKTFYGRYACFNSTGTSLIVTVPGTAKIDIIDIASGQVVKSFIWKTEESIKSIVNSPDGKSFICVVNNNYDLYLPDYIFLCDIGGDKSFLYKTFTVFSVKYTTDSKKIIVSQAFDMENDYISGIEFFDLERKIQTNIIKSKTNSVQSVSFVDNYSFISGYENGDLRKWGGTEISKTYKGHPNAIYSISTNPFGNNFITGSRDNSIKLWNYKNYNEEKTYTGHKFYVNSVAYTTDGKFFISSAKWHADAIDSEVKIWNIASGRDTTFESNNGVHSASSSVDSKNYFVHTYKGIYLYSIETGELIKSYDDLGYTEGGFALSSNNEFFIISNGSQIKMVNIKTGGVIKTLSGNRTDKIKILPDNKTFICATGNNIIQQWSIELGKVINSFQGHTDDIYDLSISPDGKTFVSASGDNTVKVWSLETGKELATVIAIDSSDWVVTTPQGHFDASAGAMQQMYYLVGLERLELNQLKTRFYEPGLLKKIMQGENLRDVQGFNNIKLPPQIELSPIIHGKIDIKIHCCPIKI